MMKSSVFGAAQTFNRLRSTLNTGAVHAGARQPFKFLLCGDPGQVEFGDGGFGHSGIVLEERGPCQSEGS